MPAETFSTTQVARAAGVHPNTIRLYEAWGYLSPVPRNPRNGYRQFTAAHLAQARVIHTAHALTWVMGDVRKTGLALIACTAAEDWAGAARLALQLRALIAVEREQAEAAAAYLEQWARGERAAPGEARLPQGRLQTAQAARLLDTTIDCLRNWERNGLLRVPRDPRNGYRRYGPEEIGRLRVIRALLRSRYSIMAILRMLTTLDGGQRDNLRQVLDTPRPDEDVFFATDRWLTTLHDLEQRADALVALTAGSQQRFELAAR